MLTFYPVGEKGIPAGDPSSTPELSKRALWIDLFQPTREEELAVEAALGFEIPTREEMQEIELSRRLYKEKDVLFMTATLLSRSADKRPVSSAVTFILTGAHLVTLRYTDPTAFRMFAQRWNNAPKDFPTPKDAFAGVLDAVVERLADILELTATGLDELLIELSGVSPEGTAPVKPPQRDYAEILRGIGRQSDLASRTRESITSVSRVIAYIREIAREDKAWHEVLAHLNTVATDLTSLADHANFLMGKISFLLDATLGLINNEQNAIIKVISVAAMVIGPPTLIAGIYGMNFTHIPEFHWYFGYPYALTLMVLSAVLPWVYFKRKKWV